jgi:hypothetical protein
MAINAWEMVISDFGSDRARTKEYGINTKDDLDI